MNLLDIRLCFFLVGLCGFFSLGRLFAYRNLRKGQWPRWANNLIFGFLGVLVVWAVAPVSLAVLAQTNQVGLFSYLGFKGPFVVVASVIILDLVIYWQHRLFHSIPVFWRLHRVHHLDTGFDTTTALRFHPAEILISFFVKATVVVLLGISVTGIVVFEIVLNFSAMFNHANVSLPDWVERRLRLFIVTPDFHRVHHSKIENETNSNFGFFLSIWDALFQTRRLDSKADLQSPDSIGLAGFQASENEDLYRLLNSPFFP